MRHRDNKGQALVEFALTLPLLLIVLFGIVEFSLVLYNQAVITNASREGARVGIILRSPRVPYSGADSIDTAVQQYSSRLITFGAANAPVVAVTPAYDPNALFGTDLTVRVTYNYTFLVLPNFLGWADDLLTLEAETVMKYE